MATNWIIDSGQAWKLYLALAGFGGAVLCFTLAFFRMALGSGQFLGLTASGLVLGVGTFLWFVATVRCPHCHAKLVWHMVASRPHSSWLIDLAALEDCPKCHQTLAMEPRRR